jgi:hypothetical protein
MTNVEGMTESRSTKETLHDVATQSIIRVFVLRASLDIRHSSFVIASQARCEHRG